MKIKLIMPSEQYKEQIMEYKREFIRNSDILHGTAGLNNTDTFEEWFDAWKDNRSEETVREGLVPATTYLAVDESDRVVGMIDIRHRLNFYLLKCGGHIGYSIRKSERRKGYATQMLALALEECKKLHINKVLITCAKDNIASEKTIRKNGGVFENEVLDGNEIIKRFWITLTY